MGCHCLLRASRALACNCQKGKSVAEQFSDSSPVFPLDASVIKAHWKGIPTFYPPCTCSFSVRATVKGLPILLSRLSNSTLGTGFSGPDLGHQPLPTADPGSDVLKFRPIYFTTKNKCCNEHLIYVFPYFTNTLMHTYSYVH